MTRRELFDRISAPLVPLYGGDEALRIAALAAERLCGVRRVDAVLDPSAEVSFCAGYGADDLARMVEELVDWRPVHYVLGEAWFCGRRYAVREGVLIPRPETEELVAWVAAEEGNRRTPLRLLDAGTGSGCIALSLKGALPEAHVTAVDMSDDALTVARENARELGLEVDFRQEDLLDPSAAWLAEAQREPYGVIVSNPPYVPEAARRTMRPNVTRYEPPGALYVPDADPLVFYRAIARLGRRMLQAGGRIYVEIFEEYGDALEEMLAAEGYEGIGMRRDIHDKPRMMRCVKKRG